MFDNPEAVGSLASRRKRRVPRAVGLLLLASGLLLIVSVAAPATQPIERVFSYLHSGWVIALCYVVAVLLSRGLLRTRDRFSVGPGIIVAILAYALDPYSYGYDGGHTGIQPSYVWQTQVTACLVVVLGIALALINRRRWVRWLVSIEALTYVILNGYLLRRDGPAVRFFAGEYLSPLPLFLLLAGLVARGYVMWRAAIRAAEIP